MPRYRLPIRRALRRGGIPGDMDLNQVHRQEMAEMVSPMADIEAPSEKEAKDIARRVILVSS